MGASFVGSTEAAAFPPLFLLRHIQLDYHFIRTSSSAAAFGIVCCLATQQLWQLWRFRRAERNQSAAATRARSRYVERIWSIISQGTSEAGHIPFELGEPDASGVFKYVSDPGAPELFFRLALSGGGSMFQWSLDAIKWYSSLDVDMHTSLCEDHQILIQRLVVEEALSKEGIQRTASSITFPPALELPTSLQFPESVSNTIDVPQSFRCPLGSGVMAEPVVTPSGLTYDRQTIETWLENSGKDPATGQALSTTELYPNIVLRDLIQAWTVSNSGVLDPHLVQRVTQEIDSDSITLRSPTWAAMATPRAPPSSVDLPFHAGSGRTPGIELTPVFAEHARGDPRPPGTPMSWLENIGLTTQQMLRATESITNHWRSNPSMANERLGTAASLASSLSGLSLPGGPGRPPLRRSQSHEHRDVSRLASMVEKVNFENPLFHESHGGEAPVAGGEMPALHTFRSRRGST